MDNNSDTPTLAEDRPPPLPPPSPSPSRVPLLQLEETLLSRGIHRLRSFLAAVGFYHHSSLLALVVSGFAFALFGIAGPVASICLSRCSDGGCEEYQVVWFEISAFVSDVTLAAVSLICISRNLSKYGIRRFLFVDQHHGRVERFQMQYFHKIQDFFCLLLWWTLPCLVIKTGREILRVLYIFHESIWKSIVVLLASIISWTYSIIILLSASLLFNLVCNLQIIHFEDFTKLLERDVYPLVYLEELVRLHYNLSKISHRFRILLLLLFILVTTSQIVVLFQTTGSGRKVNFTNAGGLAASSVVQVAALVLSLHAAAKISHKAQGIASVASKWHALTTCSSCDSSQMRTTNSSANLEVIPANLSLTVFSESELESLDSAGVQNNSQLVSYMSSYHNRQALAVIVILCSNSQPLSVPIWSFSADHASPAVESSRRNCFHLADYRSHPSGMLWNLYRLRR